MIKSSTKTQTDRKKIPKVNINYVLISIILILLVVVAALIATRESAKSHIATQGVCTSDDIGRYNEILGSTNIDASQLAEFSQSLVDREGHQEDSNCLFMISQGAGYSGDEEQALAALEVLKGRPAYASGEINTLTSLRDLEAVVSPMDDELGEQGSM